MAVAIRALEPSDALMANRLLRSPLSLTAEDRIEHLTAHSGLFLSAKRFGPTHNNRIAIFVNSLSRTQPTIHRHLTSIFKTYLSTESQV